jgi:hypothetical protein
VAVLLFQRLAAQAVSRPAQAALPRLQAELGVSLPLVAQAVPKLPASVPAA